MRKLARDGFASKRSVTHAILGLFQKAYKSVCHAYSAIVDCFVIVSFFTWETLYSAVLSFNNMLRLCQIMPMFWSRCSLFWGDKPFTFSYTRTQRFLLLRSCAYPNSFSKFGFPAGFRLQNEAFLQLYVGIRVSRFPGFLWNRETGKIKLDPGIPGKNGNIIYTYVLG